jgi:hypothetical protein
MYASRFLFAFVSGTTHTALRRAWGMLCTKNVWWRSAAAGSSRGTFYFLLCVEPKKKGEEKKYSQEMILKYGSYGGPRVSVLSHRSDDDGRTGRCVRLL